MCYWRKEPLRTYLPRVLKTFLHVVLHLALIATLEDQTDEDEMTEESLQSFVAHALSKAAKAVYPGHPTIISLLQKISTMDDFSSCGPRIRLILRRFSQKRPRTFSAATASLRFPYDRIDTGSPASTGEGEAELKKKTGSREAS